MKNIIPVKIEIDNRPIVAKIMDTVAKPHQCRVKCCPHGFYFLGDETKKAEIIEEACGIIEEIRS